MDYTAPPPVLLVQAGVHGPDAPLCFQVSIVNDDSVEPEECFGVLISLGNETADLMLSIADDRAFSLCCIQDDDGKHQVKLRQECMDTCGLEGALHHQKHTCKILYKIFAPCNM